MKFEIKTIRGASCWIILRTKNEEEEEERLFLQNALTKEDREIVEQNSLLLSDQMSDVRVREFSLDHLRMHDVVTYSRATLLGNDTSHLLLTYSIQKKNFSPRVTPQKIIMIGFVLSPILIVRNSSRYQASSFFGEKQSQGQEDCCNDLD